MLRNVLLLWYQQTGLKATWCSKGSQHTLQIHDWLHCSPPWLSSCTLQIYFSGPLISLRVHLYFYRSSKMKEHSSLKRKKKLPDQCNPKILLPIAASNVNCVKEDDKNSFYKIRSESSTWHCKFPSLWQRYEQLGPRGLCWFLQDAGSNFEIGIEWIQC